MAVARVASVEHCPVCEALLFNCSQVVLGLRYAYTTLGTVSSLSQ